MATYHGNDPLAVIYNEGYWRINKVSPMFGLNYSQTRLKQYASKISQALAADVASRSYSKFTIVVENLSSLKYSREDPNGLMIKVCSTSQNKGLYEAIFLSWGFYSNVYEATNLPYMLERGEQKIGVIVKNTLRILFDCNIVQFNFTQHQLLQLGFHFIQRDTSRTTDPFTLSYKTPQANFKDKFTLTFEIGDLCGIWQWIRGVYSSQEDPYSKAYQVLQNQMHDMINLDINVFDLYEVILPKAEVKSSGVVKVKTPEMIDVLFIVLNHFISNE